MDEPQPPQRPEFPSIPQPPPPPPIPPELQEPAERPRPAAKPRPETGMWGMAKAWGIALDFIFTVMAGGALGWGYDKWRGTAPNGVMIGLALGFVVAFIRIVRTTLRQEAEEQRKKRERQSSGR